MRAGINYIDKDDFLALYLQARIATYSQSTIQSRFRATGLVPFNPDEVLSRLHIQIQTLLPPRLVQARGQAPPHWIPKTLYNIAELELQTKAV
jgi:hypothetical protein